MAAFEVTPEARVRQCLDRRSDILPTAFANDDKGIDSGSWNVEHESRAGE